MNPDLFRRLLAEGEGPRLDFKRDAYDLSAPKKSEVLKDILAMANGWGDTDAHILFGVEEAPKPGHTPQIFGIQNHLDDASLQQFVNQKHLNRKILFRYVELTFESKPVAAITIPRSQRPMFLTKRFDDIASHTVFIRIGTSTAIADPDEIYEMGRSDTMRQQKPALDVQFAEAVTGQPIGKRVTVRPTILKPLADADLPDTSIQIMGFDGLEFSRPIQQIHMPDDNEHYYEELRDFVALTRAVSRIHFAVKNDSSVLAQKVRGEIRLPTAPFLLVLDREPTAPKRKRFLAFSEVDPSVFADVSCSKRGNEWHIYLDFGNVPPRNESWLASPLLISVPVKTELTLAGRVYADNCEPIQVALIIDVDPQFGQMTKHDLESAEESEDD